LGTVGDSMHLPLCWLFQDDIGNEYPNPSGTPTTLFVSGSDPFVRRGISNSGD